MHATRILSIALLSYTTLFPNCSTFLGPSLRPSILICRLRALPECPSTSKGSRSLHPIKSCLHMISSYRRTTSKLQESHCCAGECLRKPIHEALPESFW